MKTVRFVLVTILVTLFIFAGVYPARADSNLPTCGWGNTVPERFQNHVEFSATWVNGSSTGEYPFDFGDSSPKYVLTGSDGGSLFGHDYPIVTGQAVTYYFGFVVYNDSGDTRDCQGSVTIDYRPYQVFLPLITNPVPEPPTCFVNPVVVSSPNQIRFDFKWDGAFALNHKTDFGDGTSTEELSGASGTQSVSHSFPWPGGNFVVSTDFTGPGGTTNCSLTLQINWP